MSATSTPAVVSISWFEEQFEALKTEAISLWSTAVSDVESFANTVLPQLELDVETALAQFGSALLADAIKLLSGGITPGETASTVVTNLVQTVESQGKTIGIATAQTAAQQVTTAALAGLAAAAAQVADAPALSTPAP